MKALFARLHREYGWNEKILTAKDFDNICEDKGIQLLIEPMRRLGAYLVCDNVPFIFLKKQLTEQYKQFVQWHELGHYFMHSPNTCFCIPGSLAIAEFQADAFAACALIPQPLFLGHGLNSIIADYRYSQDLLSLRNKVFHRFKL